MIGENIKNNIDNFLGVTSASLCSTGIPLLGTENNQFSIYMTNHIFNSNITEIPIYNSLSSREIIPLFTFSSTSIKERKTFGPLLKELSFTRGAGALNKVRDKDGNFYYGMRGLIFNSNLEPLVLCTIRPGTSSDTTELILRVSPKVFNSDNVVCKGIQKYLIAYCSTVSRYFSIVSCFTTMTVIINNDIDKFIRHVKAPTNINVNEEIQQLLVDNIDKLCL